MSARRRVHVSDSFFEQLDELLGAERGPSGQPSKMDFLIYELPEVIERFATGWDELPMLEQTIGGGCVLVQAGLLVHVYAVYGLLVTDGSIELIGLNVQLGR